MEPAYKLSYVTTEVSDVIDVRLAEYGRIYLMMAAFMVASRQIQSGYCSEAKSKSVELPDEYGQG